jgi:hypothetical protein
MFARYYRLNGRQDKMSLRLTVSGKKTEGEKAIDIGLALPMNFISRTIERGNISFASTLRFVEVG